MFDRHPKKNKNLINNNRYLLKKYKREEQSEQALVCATGRDFTKLTPAQMVFLCLCVVACFPVVSSRVNDKLPVNGAENTPTSDPLGSKVSNGTASAAPTLFYKGHPARNVTNYLSGCESKPDGMQQGKKCNVEKTTYYLKKYSAKHLFYHGKYIVAKDRILLAKFNLAFLKDNIGISVPNAEIFYEGDEIYYASQAVDGFAPVLSMTYFHGLHAVQQFLGFELMDESAMLTNGMTRKIDSVTVPKFLVATTFISDITRNINNWGTNDKGELFIIDVDISPTDLSEYFDQVIDVFSRSPAILVSLENLTGMKQIYETMLLKPLPKKYDSVGISQEDYIPLLHAYIAACDYAVTQARLQHPRLNDQTASRFVNNLFLDSIKDSKNKLTKNYQHS